MSEGKYIAKIIIFLEINQRKMWKNNKNDNYFKIKFKFKSDKQNKIKREIFLVKQLKSFNSTYNLHRCM